MANLDNTIRKLLKNSLFLDISKRDKIESLLPKITKTNKEGLLKILQSEEQVIKKEITGFLGRGGTEADLNRLFLGQKGVAANAIEKAERATENEKMEKLISEIN